MAAMLSLTPSKFAGSALFFPRRSFIRRPISATRIPPSPPPAPPGQVYQPFRPPPSQLPSKYQSLDPAERLEILRDRLGLWHEYAPLISSLLRDGFTPSSIEEATGLSGVHQNRLIVAAQVRDSLLSSPSFPPDLLPFFDHSTGADLLYEIRLLNAVQRTAAALHAFEHGLDGKGAQDLARAVKDFPRRRGDVGWDCFSGSSPRDCLAYTHLRLSREAMVAAERVAALEKAMEVVETEEARRRIEEEMNRALGKAGAEVEGDGASIRVVVPVVRLRYGEVAEATTVRLLPVCKEEDGEEGVLAAPGRCRDEGRMGVVTAERDWGRWVVLPRWEPVAGAEEGVGVEFADARVLPWRTNRWEKEEGVLAVVDRGRREVAEEYGLYLVAGGDGGRLGVERGRKLWEKGVKEALGTVVLVVRPPMEQENENPMADDDWE